MLKKSITTLFLLMFTLMIPGFAQIDQVKVDSIITRSAMQDSFEGNILIADGGEIVLQRSIFAKDVEQVQEIDKDTKFGIASITKMITAIVILQLVPLAK